MINENRLSEVISKDVTLRLVEPHIYSIHSTDETASGYDKWGLAYELVACNRFYNRLVWGYWPSEYYGFSRMALNASTDGWVLDAGCGSLAFTARTYLNYSNRPVILMDNSIKMLTLAKSRLINQNGKIPDNIVFLHADILQLPFKPNSFGTIISLNVLHAIPNPKTMLQELSNVLIEEGSMSFSTLVENSRFADKYLHKLGDAGALFPRSASQLFSVFDELDISIKNSFKGNLVFINHGI